MPCGLQEEEEELQAVLREQGDPRVLPTTLLTEHARTARGRVLLLLRKYDQQTESDVFGRLGVQACGVGDGYRRALPPSPIFSCEVVGLWG